MTRMSVTSVLVNTALVLLGGVSAVPAQVHQVATMNSAAIRALDRSKTAVILPGGILEEHGPYLPSFSDGYQNEWLTQRLGEAIVARPGWQVLVFPTIPLGVGGANEIGRQYVFPGTYAVRSGTLRAVFMDLATELGEQGFRWIFVVHGHGAPNHNRMLQQACDYFRDVYGGHMVHLTNLELEQPGPTAVAADAGGPSEAERKEDGFTVHAGLSETSSLLFVRPDLVSPDVSRALPQSGRNWNDLIRLARSPDWPGYFGSPRLASAAHGVQEMKAGQRSIQLALKILDGLDERQLLRISDNALQSEPNVEIDSDALQRERRIEGQQRAWLGKHPIAIPKLNP